MTRLDMGNITLEGPDRNTWKEPNLEDMVSLDSPSNDEGFYSELTLHLIHLYHLILGRYIHVRFYHYIMHEP